MDLRLRLSTFYSSWIPVPSDKLKFEIGGGNGVYIKEVYVNDTKINQSPFWIDANDSGNGNGILVTPFFVIQGNEIVMNHEILNNSKFLCFQ